MNTYIYILMIGLCAFNSCKKPYLPTVVATNSNYLVVEGTINTSQDLTVIKLSRTTALYSDTLTKPELNATVEIESDANISYPLTERGNGLHFKGH
ncbi:DUF4249 family protein [Mucilaginibacter sp. McL0603]|uniref:DUF4249 family protein n=1 Tax=Mucilaginibacter sp. McL0603 TaxID=3415670 RepID=UPI003CED9749